MFETTKSADGTVIAYERSGRGDPLIVLGGAGATRQSGLDLAALLDHNFTVYSVQRRDAGDLDREVEDLAALIHSAGGEALVYGHSSGGTLALAGASAGLRIRRLAVYEPIGDGFEQMTIPTLVISGGAGSSTLAIPGATHHVIDGQDHGVAFDALAPVLEEFFG